MARSEIVTTGLHQQTVAGAVTLGVQHEHVYELTGGASPVVTLDGYPGAQVAIVWAGTAGTVEGQPVADGETWVAVRLSSGWRLYAVSNPVPGDETAPTAGTLSASSISDAGFTLTVTGASDDVALHASPFRFSTDNGVTWSAWQASPQLVVSGLSASTTYQCQHEVRDSSGKTSAGAVVPVTTTGVVVPLRDRLLSYAPQYLAVLDDSAGATTVPNIGTAGGTLTVNGTPTFGRPGMADAPSSMASSTSNYVNLPNTTIEGQTQATVMILVRRVDNTVASPTLLGKNLGWGVKMAPSADDLSHAAAATLSGTHQGGFVPFDTDPHLVGFTFDNGTVTVYLDGAPVKTASGLASPIADPQPTWKAAIGVSYGNAGDNADVNYGFVLAGTALTAGQMMDAAVSAGVA
ncbi:hypothetical protein PTQ19_07185 [Microbacterium esteraromaticum]|uniref:hypothetical protein n=1 Tax=Microbacterium esteraromaticum TaxID=57043 RepID=UPI00236897B2|nr:hypothetical protein [Microbacterium esteraromaticum]WDH77938.1 hypothetical protein PTQ19_10430 [Microbacterium esteraromaticum]WDH80207.1 hypothetical protein PTQ19_07185 [Microbacterium esteraromaticum]